MAPLLNLSGARALVFGLFAVVLAGTQSRSASAEAFLLVDAASGKVLHAENATYPWYPASLSKLMTLYVTLNAVKEHRLAFDTLVTVSANAAAQAPSKMGFSPGTQLTVDNAIKMLMVKSANDMAVVLAEGVDGSIDKFAEEMNATARRLGMTQTSYVNPNGLPDDRQVTSARDMAILARALIRDFPEHDLYWHIPAIKLGKRVMHNYNPLIDRYPGTDGMKTGFICASGFNLVASATRNGRRLIAVILGAPSSAVRTQQAAKLLESGFNSTTPVWLEPMLGSVDQLKPIPAVVPPDLHDQTCGPHRKRPAAEAEEEPTTATGDAEAANVVQLSSLQNAPGKSGPLVGPLVPSMPPIVVFTGATYKPPVAHEPAHTAKAAPHKRKGKGKAKPAKGAPAAKQQKQAGAASADTSVWSSLSPGTLVANPPSSFATVKPAAVKSAKAKHVATAKKKPH